MPEEKKSKEERLKDIRLKFKAVKEHSFEVNWRKNALIWLKFFTGEDQGWDKDGARAILEGENRPALTLNHIHPIIRLVCGSKPDIETTYMAVEEGDLQTAAIMNSAKDHIDDINKWKFKEDELLKLAVILNRVVIGIQPDYSKDPRGEIKLSVEDGWGAYPDPDATEKDRSDAMFFFFVKPVSKEWLLDKWPGKEEDIEGLEQYVDHASGTQSRDASRVDRYKDVDTTDYYDFESKKFSLVYYWYKEFERSVKIINQMTGEVYDAKPGVNKEQAEKEIKDIDPMGQALAVTEREFTRIKYVTFMGDILFEEGTTPWERKDGQRTDLSDSIPYLVVEPDRITFGGRQDLIAVIEMFKDPQMYHNKLASSILHIINTTAKSGYDYERGAISPENKDKLEKEASKPGTNIEWETGALSGQKVMKKKADNIPQAEMALSREFSKELLDISGVESLVSTQALGKGASGVAIDLKQRQGGNIIDWIYRSHSFFTYRLTEFIRDAIQTLYDYEKVIRIRGRKSKYIRINEQTFDEVTGIEKILNDVTSGSFDVQIREKIDAPTLRLERFKHFSEMVKSGTMQLPPQVITSIVMDLMDDPDLKETVENELGEFMMQQQQIMAQQGQGVPLGVPAGGPPPQLQPQLGV